MDNLIIAATTSTPEVHFDAASGLLLLRGESYPENAFEFFRPLIEWVSAFLALSSGAVHIDLALTYLNTSSIKSLLDVLDLLEEVHRDGRAVALTWRYDEENDRALDLAEEFREEVTIPFTLVAEK